MPICKRCESKFPNKKKIDGKFRNFQNRKYCLDCSPFDQHNTKKIHINPIQQKGLKMCNRCKKNKPTDEFYSKRNGNGFTPYCKPCTSNQTVERQQAFKKQCVEYKGGKCAECDYDYYVGALEFHHLDPNEKDFSISHVKLTAFDDRIKKELDKCIILCSRCHKEEHARLKGLL